MNTETIIAELRLYNRWRRGDEAITAPDPTALGKLLDAAADSLASLIASNTTLRRERNEAREQAAAEHAKAKAEFDRSDSELAASVDQESKLRDNNAEALSALGDALADLARVTAERDANLKTAIAMSETCSRQDETTAALRARVAELENSVDWHQRNTESCRDDSAEIGLRKQVAELRIHLSAGDSRWRALGDELVTANRYNAELVAALRKIELLSTQAGSFGAPSFDEVIRGCFDIATSALARAESADTVIGPYAFIAAKDMLRAADICAKAAHDPLNRGEIASILLGASRETPLTLTEILADYRRLDAGEIICAGDLYHRRDIPTAGSTENAVYTFSPVDGPEVRDGAGGSPVGLMYLMTYPHVLRPNVAGQPRDTTP